MITRHSLSYHTIRTQSDQDRLLFTTLKQLSNSTKTKQTCS